MFSYKYICIVLVLIYFILFLNLNFFFVKEDFWIFNNLLFLRTRRPFKAPGNDSIPNGFLRTMGLPLAQAIASLTTAC